MALEKAIAGQTHTGQRITWYEGGGTTPHDLTGAAITGRLLDQTTLIARAIAGTLVVFDGDAGEFDWTYATGDVAAGIYAVQFTATYSDSTRDRTFAETWVVEAAL